MDVNTNDMPGAIKLVFVSFDTKIMSVEKFNKSAERYQLLDQRSPEAAMLRGLLGNDKA